MREKILYGERVPNPNSPGSLSNGLRGAHSPKIKSRPDFVSDRLQIAQLLKVVESLKSSDAFYPA
jgi:hypothetical protein